MLKALSHTQYIMQVMSWVGKVVSVVFQFIPMPVLYGVFLYMGVASLNGVQVGRPDHLISPLYLETPRQTRTHTRTHNNQILTLIAIRTGTSAQPANKQTKARSYWTAFLPSVSPSEALSVPLSGLSRLPLCVRPSVHGPPAVAADARQAPA